MTSRAARTHYFIGRDGTLYRQRGAQMDLFSSYSTGDWCPVQVPTRYPLRPISRIAGWVRLARARWAYRRFMGTVSARPPLTLAGWILVAVASWLGLMWMLGQMVGRF